MTHLTAATLTALLTLAPLDTPPEGCTPGYWKNHTERWDGAGNDDFTATVQHHDLFNAFFGVTAAQSGKPDTATLLEAAQTGGGGLNALGRHAAAGAASADAGIQYAYTVQEVVDIYRDGVGADAGPLDVDSAKDALESANEAGCPLGNEPPDVTSYCFGDEGNCPCGDFLNGGCMHTGGQGALLARTGGSASVAADDLVLTTSQLPQNSFALTFMGPGVGDLPFGNGRLCVSPNGAKLFRFLPAQNSGANGTIQIGTGIVAASQINAFAGGDINPGQTWYFQTYFRDVGGCQVGFNLSNAVRVDFQP